MVDSHPVPRFPPRYRIHATWRSVMDEMQIRTLQPTDPLDQLTALLHRAYARLAAMGLNFVATDQTVETTRRRIAGGTCFVAEEGRAIVGTITWYAPERTDGSPWLDRPDVSSLVQFGVEPGMQGRGIGGALFRHAEQHARARGVKHLALDTAEQATHLVTLYERWGYRFVEHVRFGGANYRSVILSKPLGA